MTEEEEKKKLRRRAEKMVQKGEQDVSGLSHDDVLNLVHELEVHQVELEIQKEELEAAREDLARAHDRYRDLYDFAPVGYLSLSKHNIIREANITISRMLGIKREDLLKRRLTEFIDPKSQDEFYRCRREILGTGKSQKCELFIHRVKGGSLWAEIEGVPDSDGSRITITDISKRMKAEEELGMQASVLETIMANTDTQLVYFDRDFNFIRANKAYTESCGHTWDELEGRNHFSFFPNTENEAIFRQVVDTGKAVIFHDKSFEYADQPQRGVTYWDWTLVPIKDRADEVTGLVLSLIETTDRKKMVQLKDEFIGMVSHELKTPLTVILGALHTATASGISDEDSHILVKEAIYGAESMAGIVENLLELSRSQADRLELQPQPTDLGQTTRDVIHKLVSKSAKHHINVHLPEELPAVLVDPVRVERVLFNLVENALKYSPDGGEITISAHRKDDNMVVCVRNQGPGISAKDQKKLFQSFEQLAIRNRDPMQGVGLGLKVCHTLVEAHGGRIWVESEPGKGASFCFTLPIKNGPSAEHPSSSPTTSSSES